MAPAEREYPDLELAPGAVRRRFRTDRQAEELGLAEGRGELGWGEEGAEVGERSSRVRDRDSIAPSAVTGNEGGRAMEDDAVPLPDPGRPRDSDMNRNGLPVDARRGRPASATPDVPELCGAQVTEYGVVTAGEYGRHPVRPIAESGMADGIDTAMNAVQAARLDASADGAGGDSDEFELPHHNDTVLPRRDPGNEEIRGRFVAFCPHVREQSDNRADFAPSIAERALPDRPPSSPLFLPTGAIMPDSYTVPRRWRASAHSSSSSRTPSSGA